MNRPPTPSDAAAARLAALAADFWDHLLERSPLTATAFGDWRGLDRLDDQSPAALAAHEAALAARAARLAALDPDALDEADRVTHAALGAALDDARGALAHEFHQWAVEPLDSPPTWLYRLPLRAPLASADQCDALVRRLEDFGRWTDQHLAHLRAGMARGRVATAMACERVAAQLAPLCAAPVDESPLLHAVTRARAAGHDDALLARFEADLRRAIERVVRPAFGRLHEFLTRDYRPRTDPAAVGMWAVPEGDAAYAFLVRHYTTLDLTPAEIHECGRATLAGIEAEMEAVAAECGFPGNVRGFQAALIADPAQQPRTREEVVADAEAVLDRVRRRLPEYFTRLPAAPCVVKPIETYREADCPAAFYERPQPGGENIGIYWVNAYQPHTRLKFNAPALAVHEALPGHHLQLALAQELDHLPAFRRHLGATAFVEGWALYAERLCVEMGIYETPQERFGMLTYQAWRAARLVVDTGLHALRWPRDRALDFYRERLAIAELEIVNEIDRYITLPAQALAYTLGEREISALRREAEAALGPRFDLRTFHERVLENGAVGLAVLRGHLDRRAAAEAAAPHPPLPLGGVRAPTGAAGRGEGP